MPRDQRLLLRSGDVPSGTLRIPPLRHRPPLPGSRPSPPRPHPGQKQIPSPNPDPGQASPNKSLLGGPRKRADASDLMAANTYWGLDKDSSTTAHPRSRPSTSRAPSNFCPVSKPLPLLQRHLNRGLGVPFRLGDLSCPSSLAAKKRPGCHEKLLGTAGPRAEKPGSWAVRRICEVER
ncbi:hypothetical protein MKZ38_003461 [Zalerion maritima]|uniref:Uncharacterized protein n=1 Tax=Zalerion maritima TaxID=339359 RepID=A0AAD5RYW8_9PEZI|nr:hypothetical protein MKZ38_003461 [Zalerion maritima]